MDSSKQALPAFDLCGGHPALDLVNTLAKRFEADGPVELLASYGDLLRFARQAGQLDARRAQALSRSVASASAAQALGAARELREALAATFYGKLAGRPPGAADVRVLERQFLSAQRHRKLHWVEGSRERTGMRWERGEFARSAELPVWILAERACELMMSDAWERVRACDADTCRWLFLDTSKNHTRRWCTMKTCGNRMKARRFQARRA